MAGESTHAGIHHFDGQMQVGAQVIGRGATTLLVPFVLAAGAYAADEMENTIPVELARALFDLPDTGELRFYPRTPEGFPEFTVPPEFQLMGGMSLPNFSRVALHTELELSEGMSVLASALQSDGYLLTPAHPPAERGFVAARTMPTPMNVCHEERGSMLIRALKRGEAHYFSLTGDATVDTSGTTCAERVAERQRFIDGRLFRESSGIRAYLPRLALPQELDTEYDGFQPSFRSSGSNTEYVVSSVIRSERDIAAIYQHFAEQLRSQQWAQGREHTVGNFHQGEWQFINENDQLISGALLIEKQDQDTISLRFTITTARDFYIQRPGEPTLIQ